MYFSFTAMSEVQGCFDSRVNMFENYFGKPVQHII